MSTKNPIPYAFGSNARVSALGCGFARVRRGNTFHNFALGRHFGPAYVYCVCISYLVDRRMYHTLYVSYVYCVCIRIDGASRETSRVACFFFSGRATRASAARVIRPFSSSSSTRRGDRRCRPSRKGTPFRRTRERSRRPTGSRSSRTPS